MKTNRTTEWFDDDSFWRELAPYMFSKERFKEAARQVWPLLKLARPRGKVVLDLGCGPGRWAIPLARAGLRVTGVDRTEFLLVQARTRARRARKRIEWVQQDMRDFIRPATFDIALSLFTSFGYFNEPDEDRAVLANVFASLQSGGVFVLEMMGKEILARIFQSTTSERLADGSLLVQRHEVFDGWSRVRNEWTLVKDGKARTWRFHVTIYSGQELRDRLEHAGFTQVQLFGSFAGDEYGVNAQRLIAVARRPK